MHPAARLRGPNDVCLSGCRIVRITAPQPRAPGPSTWWVLSSANLAGRCPRTMLARILPRPSIFELLCTCDWRPHTNDLSVLMSQPLAPVPQENAA